MTDRREDNVSESSGAPSVAAALRLHSAKLHHASGREDGDEDNHRQDVGDHASASPPL
jgi:hypothetical protein